MSEKKYMECPYCGEDIRVTARKCKHCGEWLDDDDEEYDDDFSEGDDDSEADEQDVVAGDKTKIVVNPNIVVQNHNHQEQHVIVSSGGSGESDGCLWTQVALVAVGLGFAFKGFWYGVAAFILLAIAIFIPYLGPALCVILGLAFGVVAGVLSAAFGAATWIAWLIGIVSSIALVMWNLEDRKS